MEEPTNYDEALLIDRLGLKPSEVLQIVKEWYMNIDEIFMNSDGEEIDEYADDVIGTLIELNQ